MPEQVPNKLEPDKDKQDTGDAGKDALKYGAYLSLGGQLAGTVGLFVFLGYWLDQHYGWTPWSMVVGGFLGVTLGLYHFVRSTSGL